MKKELISPLAIISASVAIGWTDWRVHKLEQDAEGRDEQIRLSIGDLNKLFNQTDHLKSQTDHLKSQINDLRDEVETSKEHRN
jgi:hypothetical protein